MVAESVPAGRTQYRGGVSHDDRDLLRLTRSPPDDARGWRGRLASNMASIR